MIRALTIRLNDEPLPPEGIDEMLETVGADVALEWDADRELFRAELGTDLSAGAKQFVTLLNTRLPGMLSAEQIQIAFYQAETPIIGSPDFVYVVCPFGPKTARYFVETATLEFLRQQHGALQGEHPRRSDGPPLDPHGLRSSLRQRDLDRARRAAAWHILLP